ncbi:MAG: hypothetical protein PHW83_11295 [Bacteroidales bacterium]|nr:hypothetical protein [Bacteroidales bacterium]
MVNLPIEYSDKKVTPFGGMSLMKRFVDSIGIREHLLTLDLPDKGSNRSYDSHHIIESFWLSIWTGYCPIRHFFQNIKCKLLISSIYFHLEIKNI